MAPRVPTVAPPPLLLLALLSPLACAAAPHAPEAASSHSRAAAAESPSGEATASAAPNAGVAAAPEGVRQNQLAYRAALVLAVPRADEAAARALALTAELGGDLVAQGDLSVTVRVPRARFTEALSRLEPLGDVLHREVRAEDLADRIRDGGVRLRNARATRDRLEALLAQARSVEDALQIERELSRVTEEIERLVAEERGLAARVAFATVELTLRPRAVETAPEPAVRLPFRWLEDLGVARLLAVEVES